MIGLLSVGPDTTYYASIGPCPLQTSLDTLLDILAGLQLAYHSFMWSEKRQVKGYSRRDECGGASPYVTALLPVLHVCPLGGGSLGPQHLGHQVTVSDGHHQLGAEAGLENLSVLLTVLHLETEGRCTLYYPQK